jgi:hypothetical protein
MKTGNKTDDFFREAMTGYQVEPSIGLWRRIERRFFPPSRFSPSGLITSGILIFIAGLMPWVLIPATGGEHAVSDAIPKGGTRGYILNPTGDPSTDHDQTVRTYSVQATYLPEEVATAKADSPATSGLNILNPSVEASDFLIADADPDAIYPSVPFRYDDESLFGETYWSIRMHSKPAGLMDARYKTNPGPSLTDQSVKSTFSSGYESEYFSNAQLSAGASFNPSLVFYDPNPYNKMLGGEANLRFAFGDWNIQGGVGFSSMEDVGTYNVDYVSYDSVGYYLDVISFIPDPRNPGNIIYTTRQVAIYDSVSHYSIEEKTNHYSYLDIPVSVGYTLYQRNRISIMANAGIKFSVLVAKDEPTVEFNVSNGELINVESQVPERMPTNWRFTAGLDFGYTLTDKVSFHLEPVFEQYISPLYAKQPGIVPKKPAVTGLKAGFRYTF